MRTVRLFLWFMVWPCTPWLCLYLLLSPLKTHLTLSHSFVILTLTLSMIFFIPCTVVREHTFIQSHLSSSYLSCMWVHTHTYTHSHTHTFTNLISQSAFKNDLTSSEPRLRFQTEQTSQWTNTHVHTNTHIETVCFSLFHFSWSHTRTH